jgi:hypothetical protein
MGADSAIKIVDGMADLRARASARTALNGKVEVKWKKQFSGREPKLAADDGRSDEKANR